MSFIFSTHLKFPKSKHLTWMSLVIQMLWSGQYNDEQILLLVKSNQPDFSHSSDYYFIANNTITRNNAVKSDN